jgi:hypothetical protein
MRLSDHSTTNLISYFLSRGKEGEWWDFKQEWHCNMPDLIKDIICFTNTVHDEDCYLIFGVSDDLKLTGMQKTRKKQVDIIDALSNLHFAGDHIPQVEIEQVSFEGFELDVLRIFDTDRTPIYIKKPYGNMKQGCIYSRNGDKNTPDNGNAEIYEIENLWRKRLGLTKPPLEYIIDRLQSKIEWNQQGDYYYNIYKPEYTIKKYENEDTDRRGDSFFSYSQTNESTSYSTLDIMVHNTVLDSYLIANLDSGRLSVPVPEWGFLYFGKHHQDHKGYKYYTEGSDRYRVLDFLYDPENSEELTAYNNLMDVILLYHSEEERNAFEGHVLANHEKLDSLVNASKEFDYICTDSDLKTREYKEQLKTGMELNTLLREWRKLTALD